MFWVVQGLCGCDGFNTWYVALGDYDGDSRLDAAVVSEELLTFYYQTE